MNMLHFDSTASATDDARDRILADLRALAADGETLIRATADAEIDRGSAD